MHHPTVSVGTAEPGSLQGHSQGFGLGWRLLCRRDWGRVHSSSHMVISGLHLLVAKAWRTQGSTWLWTRSCPQLLATWLSPYDAHTRTIFFFSQQGKESPSKVNVMNLSYDLCFPSPLLHTFGQKHEQVPLIIQGRSEYQEAGASSVCPTHLPQIYSCSL